MSNDYFAIDKTFLILLISPTRYRERDVVDSLRENGLQAAVDLRVPVNPTNLLEILPSSEELSRYDFALVDPEIFPIEAELDLYHSLKAGERVLLYLRRHAPSLPVIALTRWLEHSPDLATIVTTVEFDAYLATAYLLSPRFSRIDWERIIERARNSRKGATYSRDNIATNERDVFICHAGEDKTEIVFPLVKALRLAAISYWYDDDEITWGDKIIDKVSRGLMDARYVIVVLSRHSVRKTWPKLELATALQSEIADGRKRVLPLIVGDEAAATMILNEIPLLKDRHYLRWEGDGKYVVGKLHALLRSQ